ncbi:PIN domain-containing protein [Cyanobium sp. Morenito 9A2]|uniref:PIN domain-containing protein n=1 Tax=Cyanobium sp. Morenito 9A2 TaxID=2823718 RepID=UPI0020CC52C5|nr:PIN domain-containing protein [Cyanobium sp. Morenito 9A2]MCP9848701.1 PIN domain-containing protein [Cyanobium sp. Morenito 9A2]
MDTNLWVYRLDRREPVKGERIRRWLADLAEDNDIIISTQVLIELRAVATRKLRPALGDAKITALLAAMAGFEVVSTELNLVLDAHQLAVRHQLSWFDALIAEATLRSGCAVLFSEDFTHGVTIGALQVINPLLDGWPPGCGA